MSKRDGEKLQLFMTNFGQAKRHSSPLILWPPFILPIFICLKSFSFYNSPNFNKFAWAQPPFAWNSSWFWHKMSSSKLNRLSQLYSMNTFPVTAAECGKKRCWSLHLCCETQYWKREEKCVMQCHAWCTSLKIVAWK